MSEYHDVILEELVKRHEGFREKAYRDTEGYLTIGYGFNIDGNVMCEEAALAQLRCDLHKTEKRMLRTIPQFKNVKGVRRIALIDMGYNLGVPGLRKFKKMWSAIGRNDWEEAACQAQDSRWFRQVKTRGTRIVEILRTGELPNDMQ